MLTNKLSIPEIKRLLELVDPMNASWDSLREKLGETLTNLVVEDANLNAKLEEYKQEIVAVKRALEDIWYDERK
jgi:hypothetical protein